MIIHDSNYQKPLHSFTVRLHEPRPPRQNFETNFEINQSKVEILTMKLLVIVLTASSKYLVNHLSEACKQGIVTFV